MTSDNPPGFTDDDRRADEEAIHALLHREITAWDAGDPDAYAAVYTPDGDCVSFLGSTTAAARRFRAESSEHAHEHQHRGTNR